MLFFRKKAVDDGAPASGARADALPPVQVIRAQAGQLAQALPAQPEPRVRLALGYVSPMQFEQSWHAAQRKKKA